MYGVNLSFWFILNWFGDPLSSYHWSGFSRKPSQQGRYQISIVCALLLNGITVILDSAIYEISDLQINAKDKVMNIYFFMGGGLGMGDFEK